MRDGYPHSKDRGRAEEVLARMVKRELGVEVNPLNLRMFLLYRWDEVQSLAHRIHDES